MSTDSATLQYRLNLSNVLHAISPALAALHTSRAAALHPEASAILHSSHCLKCGTYRFSGHQRSRTRKRKRTTSSRPLQRKCHLCGFSSDATTCTDLSLNDSSVPVQIPCGSPRTGAVPITNEMDQASPSADAVAATVPTAACARAPSLPGRPSHSKSSHAKTSTLRNMLSRDHQREEGVKADNKRKESHEGLAAFLKEL